MRANDILDDVQKLTAIPPCCFIFLLLHSVSASSLLLLSNFPFCSFVHWFIYWFIYWLIPSFIHLCVYSFVLSLHTLYSFSLSFSLTLSSFLILTLNSLWRIRDDWCWAHTVNVAHLLCHILSNLCNHASLLCMFFGMGILSPTTSIHPRLLPTHLLLRSACSTLCPRNLL